jgi:hypothetical protein
MLAPQEVPVLARLAELGIAYSRHEHPPVATVDEAAQHWAGIDATHCKNLFLRNQKGKPALPGHRSAREARRPARGRRSDRRRQAEFRVGGTIDDAPGADARVGVAV